MIGRVGANCDARKVSRARSISGVANVAARCELIVSSFPMSCRSVRGQHMLSRPAKELTLAKGKHRMQIFRRRQFCETSQRQSLSSRAGSDQHSRRTDKPSTPNLLPERPSDQYFRYLESPVAHFQRSSHFRPRRVRGRIRREERAVQGWVVGLRVKQQ